MIYSIAGVAAAKGEKSAHHRVFPDFTDITTRYYLLLLLLMLLVSFGSRRFVFLSRVAASFCLRCLIFRCAAFRRDDYA